MIRRVVSFGAWWILSAGIWFLLVGTVHDRYERLAGYGAAVVGAVAAEVVRAQGLIDVRLEWRWLRRVWRPLMRVVPELVLVLAALPRRPRGAFRALGFPSTGGGRTGRGKRAVVGAAGSLAPNSVVVHLDEERPLALVHRLLPDRGGEEPL